MTTSEVNPFAADKFTRFIDSRPGLLLLAAWAFFEPSFWFIAPDLFLWLMCLYSPKSYLKYFWVTLASALAGASFYFLLSTLFFYQLTPVLMATPFVNEGMITEIQNILATYGLAGLLFQAFSFMSVKIWVHEAVASGIPFLVFIPLTGLSRALRFFVFARVFSWLGEHFTGPLRRYFIAVVTLFTLGFLAVIVIMEGRLG